MEILPKTNQITLKNKFVTLLIFNILSFCSFGQISNKPEISGDFKFNKIALLNFTSNTQYQYTDTILKPCRINYTQNTVIITFGSDSIVSFPVNRIEFDQPKAEVLNQILFSENRILNFVVNFIKTEETYCVLKNVVGNPPLIISGIIFYDLEK